MSSFLKRITNLRSEDLSLILTYFAITVFFSLGVTEALGEGTSKLVYLICLSSGLSLLSVGFYYYFGHLKKKASKGGVKRIEETLQKGPSIEKPFWKVCFQFGLSYPFYCSLSFYRDFGNILRQLVASGKSLESIQGSDFLTIYFELLKSHVAFSQWFIGMLPLFLGVAYVLYFPTFFRWLTAKPAFSRFQLFQKFLFFLLQIRTVGIGFVGYIVYMITPFRHALLSDSKKLSWGKRAGFFSFLLSALFGWIMIVRFLNEGILFPGENGLQTVLCVGMSWQVLLSLAYFLGLKVQFFEASTFVFCISPKDIEFCGDSKKTLPVSGVLPADAAQAYPAWLLKLLPDLFTIDEGCCAGAKAAQTCIGAACAAYTAWWGSKIDSVSRDRDGNWKLTRNVDGVPGHGNPVPPASSSSKSK